MESGIDRSIEMEEKGRPLTLIFLMALIFGSALGALQCYTADLPRRLHEQEVPLANIGMILGYFDLIRTAINPFLILVGFYLAGRKIDLKANFGPSILSLIAGASIGGFVGHIITALIINPLPKGPRIELLFSAVYALGSVPQKFFVAFTALALAHIRRDGNGF